VVQSGSRCRPTSAQSAFPERSVVPLVGKLKICASIVVLICIVGAAGTTAGANSASRTHNALEPRTFVLQATSDAWVDTGITIPKGGSVLVTVSGNAKCGPGTDCPAGNPLGAGHTCADRTLGRLAPGPAPDVFYGAVGGRLGAKGTPFMIGASNTVRGPGLLFLVYEDCKGYYGDNSGSFDVRVWTQPGSLRVWVDSPALPNTKHDVIKKGAVVTIAVEVSANGSDFKDVYLRGGGLLEGDPANAPSTRPPPLVPARLFVVTYAPPLANGFPLAKDETRKFDFKIRALRDGITFVYAIAHGESDAGQIVEAASSDALEIGTSEDVGLTRVGPETKVTSGCVRTSAICINPPSPSP